MAAHLSSFIAQHGYLAVFILMALESTCIPIPSEVVMPYGGYLSYMHDLSFVGVVLVATFANVVGGLIAYAIGYYGGRPAVIRYGKYIWLNERHLEQSERWFSRFGDWAVFIGRLLPVVRTFVSLPAGFAKMSMWRFILFSAIGSLPWNIGLTYAGYQVGLHWEQIDKSLKPLTYFGVVLLIVAVVWYLLRQKRRQG